MAECQLFCGNKTLLDILLLAANLLKPLLTLNVLLCGQKNRATYFRSRSSILAKTSAALVQCTVETKVVDILDKILVLIAFVKTAHCSGEILLRALSPPWMAGPPMGMFSSRVHGQRGHRAHGHPRVQARRWPDLQLPRQRYREV